MKLYRVTCRGMQDTYGTAFAVAENSEDAYRKVRMGLDVRNLGFARERELLRVELLADDALYPDCQTILYR